MRLVTFFLISVTYLDLSNAQSNNGFDDFFKKTLTWDDTKKADDISDFLRNSLILAPFVTSFFVNDPKDAALKAGGTLLFNTLLVKGIKELTQRERPDGSDKLDFPSGHAATAMAAATLTCSMAKKSCPIVYTTAVAVGALRVMANKHHATSVIFGWGIGHTNGVLIPSFIASW